MKNLNRRSWMKAAGILGASAPILSFTPRNDLYPVRKKIPSNGPVQLCYNENPYGPSEKMREAIINSFSDVCRYPFKEISKLEKQIAEIQGVSPENIVVTGGSREGLNAAGLVFGLNNGEIISCVPTYLALLTYADHFGAYINRVPLTKDMTFDLDEMEKRISSNTKMVFVCNPNNPTGTLVDGKRLQDFCAASAERTMVFIDEVYRDYLDAPNYPTMKDFVKSGHNVIVARTFSKIYGLAGSRVGYLMARADIAQRLRGALMAGTNVMAVRAASVALEDNDFYQYSLDSNRKCKEMIYAALDDINVKYHKSHTNFVFFETGRPIAKFQAQMEEAGVLVGRAFPPYTDWCRISTGAIEEVEVFCESVKKVLG